MVVEAAEEAGIKAGGLRIIGKLKASKLGRMQDIYKLKKVKEEAMTMTPEKQQARLFFSSCDAVRSCWACVITRHHKLVAHPWAGHTRRLHAILEAAARSLRAAAHDFATTTPGHKSPGQNPEVQRSLSA